MRIGIDIHSVGSGKGGNETYYRQLVSGLGRADHVNDYALYMANTSGNDLGPLGANFHLERIGATSPYLRIPFLLPRLVKRSPVEIFHAQFIIPPFLKCRTVTTIPDIAYEHFPESFPVHQRAWSKVLVGASAKRADHIITVSEYSKRDICQKYGISEEKISVTYEAAGEEFFPFDRGKCKEELARKYGITGDFILYLGRLQARKNLLRLVEAFSQLRQTGITHKLVLAGKQDSLFEPVLSRLHELRLDEEVLLPGYIPMQDVPLFYNAADLFVYPSLFEGFGLPVLEAMACGVPVITSRGSSLEEVAGNAAVLIDPLDTHSLTAAMGSVLHDRQLRTNLSQAGLKRAAQFSNEATARQTIAVYEYVLGTERLVDRISRRRWSIAHVPGE